jgi:hypothetical protein
MSADLRSNRLAVDIGACTGVLPVMRSVRLARSADELLAADRWTFSGAFAVFFRNDSRSETLVRRRARGAEAVLLRRKLRRCQERRRFRRPTTDLLCYSGVSMITLTNTEDRAAQLPLVTGSLLFGFVRARV